MDDRYAIQLAKTEIREGYDNGDADRILAQLSPAFIDLSAGFPSCAREEAQSVFRERLVQVFVANKANYVPITANIEILGSTAIAYGWYEITLIPRSGAPATRKRARCLELWRRIDAGWKLAFLIDNLDSDPALAETTVAALRSGAMDPLNGMANSALPKSPGEPLEEPFPEAKG